VPEGELNRGGRGRGAGRPSHKRRTVAVKGDAELDERAKKILWLRTSYRIGAAADAVLAVRMLLPGAMGEATFRYAMGTSAALMLGWTLLLVWADRQPVARKGVLLLTICPAITGLLAASLYPVLSGDFTIARIVPIWVLGLSVIALMGFSYYNARGLE